MFEGIEKKYIHVDSIETVEQLLNHIEQNEILAYDTEATGLNVRKDKVIGFSICGSVGESYYFPIWKWNSEKEELEELSIAGRKCSRIASKMLSKLHGKKLLMHNGTFDVLITKNSLGVDLVEDLYCETILLIHTVQEEGVGRGGTETFGLKKVAIAIQDKIGLDVEKAANEEQVELRESIKRNGGEITRANYEIYKADFDILSKYAAADTDLTLRIFHYYSEILKAEQMEQFFYIDEVMPVYREVTIPMVEHGIAVDIPLLEQTKKEILSDMEKLKEKVSSKLLTEEPGKRWVLDTALKTFPCKKTGPWGKMFIERYSLPLPRTSRGYSTSKAAVNALDLPIEDEWQREFLLTGNPNLIPEEERIRISLTLWKESNDGEYFNIQSASQLAEIVFKYYGEKSIKSNSETGRDSFDGEVIERMSKKHKWCENLRVYRKLQKIYTTYIERFLSESEDGIYYPYWKQHGTVSGRFASNMQQLPKPMEDDQDVPIVVHYNRMVRKFMVAGPGKKFVDADFESLEPHCFASVSGDEGLRDIFKHRWDFYSTIAIKTEKLNDDKEKYPNGVSSDRKSPVFLKSIDPVKRQRAKAYSLGIPYGMSGYALGKNLGISTAEAQKLVDGYFEGFPALKEWYENSRKFMYENGYIKNLVGRTRHLPEGKKIYDTFGLNIMEASFRYSLVNQLVTEEGMDREEAEKQVLRLYMDFKNCRNNCLNFQLQSLGADVVNRAALAINRRMKREGIQGYVCAQIHDQLIVCCEESRAADVQSWMEEVMTTTTLIPGVDLHAPAELGNNMFETH